MNEPDSDLGFARLFDGFEAEMMRRVVAPGADAARRAAYIRGRRNSRAVTAFTAIAAVSVGSGVTYAVTGQREIRPEPRPSVSPTLPESMQSPGPSDTPSPSASPSPSPSTSPSPTPSIPRPPTTTPAQPQQQLPPPKPINMTLTAPGELRLTPSPSGGFHGKITFSVRNEGPSAMPYGVSVTYNLGPNVNFEPGAESSGVYTCLTTGDPYTWGCSLRGVYAAGSSFTYDVNIWTGLAASGSDQVFEFKIRVLRESPGYNEYAEQSPANNSATVRVILPAA